MSGPFTQRQGCPKTSWTLFAGPDRCVYCLPFLQKFWTRNSLWISERSLKGRSDHCDACRADPVRMTWLTCVEMHFSYVVFSYCRPCSIFPHNGKVVFKTRFSCLLSFPSEFLTSLYKDGLVSSKEQPVQYSQLCQHLSSATEYNRCYARPNGCGLVHRPFETSVAEPPFFLLLFEWNLFNDEAALCQPVVLLFRFLLSSFLNGDLFLVRQKDD
jgi:hypothetical protein